MNGFKSSAEKSPAAVAVSDVSRLRSLLVTGQLVHPYLCKEFFSQTTSPSPTTSKNPNDFTTLNFVDLAASLAMICCGVTPPLSNSDVVEDDGLACVGDNSSSMSAPTDEDIQTRRLQLAAEIGAGSGGGMRYQEDDPINKISGGGVVNQDISFRRRHIVLILCDGMGNSLLQNTLLQTTRQSLSFFHRHNDTTRLRAVFPSTTPAALTTLATATWPGRHGMPGWNLRDKKGCDFPGGGNNHQNDNAHPPVQLLVLSDHIKDARSGKLASEMGFDSWDEIFVEEPWARHLMMSSPNNNNSKTTNRRRMIYINAYNGDDYQEWSQGTNNNNDDDKDNAKKRKYSDATDFSKWQMSKSTTQHSSTLFETAKIEETAFDTLGQPKGSNDAIQYYRNGINAALDSIAKAERCGESTFTYLYTAHPDKHMHFLGVEHDEVKNVILGIESETERFWSILGDRDALLSGKYEDDVDVSSGSREIGGDELKTHHLEKEAIDATVIVTADHGHVTVHPQDMITLPECILELLEYACIGVHGKGRHAYLHCRAGLQRPLQQRWHAIDELHQHFLLLTIDEAIENGLFGPKTMRMKVRPRLGDFVAISIDRKTLVTPSEEEQFCKGCKCQGAHGSLLPEEMLIPFVLLDPSRR